MVRLRRCVRHLLFMPWRARQAFPKTLLKQIEAAIEQAEQTHRAELRFAIEGSMPLAEVCRGVSARQRAVEGFSRLRVWDTEENNGILIYVQLADHAIEIIADRGIAARVSEAEWHVIARKMEAAYHAGDFRGGSLAGIAAASALLATHFPAGPANLNELPNRPVIVG